jgi:prevent-host-death family protein
MKTMPAGRFKNACLRTLDEVARTRATIVITKRGRPVAKLVPCGPTPPPRSLSGSVLREAGDPFRTGESWDADAD